MKNGQLWVERQEKDQRNCLLKAQVYQMLGMLGKKRKECSCSKVCYDLTISVDCRQDNGAISLNNSNQIHLFGHLNNLPFGR